MSSFFNLIKETDKGKALAKKEYDTVKSLTQAGKSEYALQCAAETPLYREAIQIMGDVIYDKDIEITVFQDKLNLSEDDQTKLKILADERKAFDSKDEKNRKILESLKAQMNKYNKRGEEITSVTVTHKPKPIQLAFIVNKK